MEPWISVALTGAAAVALLSALVIVKRRTGDSAPPPRRRPVWVVAIMLLAVATGIAANLLVGDSFDPLVVRVIVLVLSVAMLIGVVVSHRRA